MNKIPGLGDMALKVRGFGNADYERVSSELVAALPLAARGDEKESNRIATTLLVETVLLDWSGLTADAKPVPFSKEKAFELLSDPAYRDLANGVSWAAQRVARIFDDSIEADAKN
ncbi:hypothetical protein [Kaistia soli]|uniref:hypothetical protein n=1 Tax=Kaistia soli TaxID=446684 RepID=UPI0015882913|nr:hypothetical protein [Kaistia soli]